MAATVHAALFFAVALLSAVTFLANVTPTIPTRPIYLQIAIFVIAIMSGTLIFMWHHATRSHNPRCYTILDLEGTLDVTTRSDHRRYVYERFQRIEATRDEVRLIEFREHWTGAGSRAPRVECRKPVDAVLLDGRCPEEDGRVHRWVYPGRPLGRGERLEVLVHQEHEDDVHAQRPYFRQGGGKYRTMRVCVSVRFSIADDPVDTQGAIWNTGRAFLQTQLVGSLPCKRTEDLASGTVEYSIEVTSTIPHHSYGVRWTWRDIAPNGCRAGSGAPPSGISVTVPEGTDSSH